MAPPALDDARYALRQLGKHRGFTAVAVLTLALAIGANTALFSVVYGVLLRPLPFREPDRLTVLARGTPEDNRFGDTVSPLILHRLQEGMGQRVEGMAVYVGLANGFNLSGDGAPERLLGHRVNADFFRTLGVSPTLGRGFTAEDDVPGTPPTVVLGHALWKNRFGGDRGILGRTLTLNGTPHTVVGVAPPSLRFPEEAQLYVPLQLPPSDMEVGNYLFVILRRAAGVSEQQLQAGLAEVTARIRAENKDSLSDRQRLFDRPLGEFIRGDMRAPLLLLLGAVGFVLLIACVNLANVQLARAASRGRELAVRVALGASRGKLLSLLLTESLMVALAGGALGALLAFWMLPGLMRLAPDALPGRDGVRMDAPVLLFTLGVSVLTGLLVGALPGLQASRSMPASALKAGGNGHVGASPRAVRARRLLVAGEVALAVMLLAGAGALLQAFSRVRAAEPGFDPRGVLTAKLSLPEEKYGTPEKLERFAQAVTERLAAQPGVEAAAFAMTLPMEQGADMTFTIEGRYTGDRDGDGFGYGDFRSVTPGYFQVLGLKLKRGRLLGPQDVAGAPSVVVINETLAQKFFKDQDPLGQRITIGGTLGDGSALADKGPREIVGVVADVRERGLDRDAPPIYYLPVGQEAPGLAAMAVRLLPHSLAVRARPGAMAGLSASLVREVQAVDGMQPVSDVRTMEERVASTLGQRQFQLTLLGGMAALALALAAVGIYGVLAYLVQQRTREMGVRVALGASPAVVFRLVVGQGLVSVLLGAGVGLALAAVLGRVMAASLPDVAGAPLLAYVAAPALLIAVAAVAAALPAWKASRVDPAVALQGD